jgi:hypothetical protein
VLSSHGDCFVAQSMKLRPLGVLARACSLELATLSAGIREVKTGQALTDLSSYRSRGGS